MISGENGILTKTKLAKQMTEISNEKEAIQLDISLANMERALNNKYFIGKPLYDKTIENIKYYQIGKVTWWNYTNFFNGKIYSARIYNKALDDREVMENYNKAAAYRSLTVENQ